MSSAERTSQSPFSLSGETPLKLPLRVLVFLAAALAGGVSAWLTLKVDVQGNSKSLSAHERRIESLESKFDAQREILSEIRADVKQLNRTRP